MVVVPSAVYMMMKWRTFVSDLVSYISRCCVEDPSSVGISYVHTATFSRERWDGCE